MSRRERETESVIGGKSSGLDGIYSLGGGGSGDGSQSKTTIFGDGIGNGSGTGKGAVGSTTWFAPIEGTASPDVLNLGECKDGVCPVPWATKPYKPDLQPDLINHPPHYTDGTGIECIEAIEAQLTVEEYRGYLKGNCAKYIWRERHKGGTESLMKARFYLDRLVELENI
jgi:hypothetical protein